MRQRSVGLLACSLVVGLLALTTAACNQPYAAPLASLRALPEAHLPIMPGATLILERSSPRDWSISSGWAPAYLDRRFGTNLGVGFVPAQRSIGAYYASILIPRGWTAVCEGCLQWRKAGFVADLSFEDTGAWSPENERGYSLIFDELLEEDFNQGLPSASPSPIQG